MTVSNRMNMVTRSVFFYWPLLMLLLSMAGCVTTFDKPVDPIDTEKAEEAHVNAGFAYLRQREFSPARHHFNAALKLNDCSAEAYSGLALAAQYEGDMDEADKFFRKSLACDPKSSMARNNYAAYLYSEGRLDDAEKHLLIVVEDKDYERRFIAVHYLGLIKLQQDQPELAMRYFQQAVGINRNFAPSHLEIADLHYKGGSYAAAREALERYDRTRNEQPSARALLLKIKLERIFGNRDEEASAVIALKNMYPYSNEYLEYQREIEKK